MRDELPASLKSLIDAERAAPIGEAVPSVVRSKLALTVGAQPLGAAITGGGALLIAGKVLVVLALVVGASVGVRAVVTTEDAPVSPPVMTSSRSLPAPKRVVVEAPAVAIPTPLPMTTSLSKPPPPAAKRLAPPAQETLPPPAPPPAQAELLREAYNALIAGDAARALATVERDTQLHPDGVLAEERAALQIEALSRLGRTAEARTAEKHFSAAYPRSVHQTRIRRAIEEK